MIKFVITEEELDQIKNDCAYPERFECDNGCEYWFEEKDIPCTFKGANILMDEVMTRTLSEELKKDRKRVLDKLESWRIQVNNRDGKRHVELGHMIDSLRGEP